MAPSERPSTSSAPARQDALLWACIACGSLLRVLWPLDIEWKFDEKWMFATALRIARGLEPWPWVGMPSGVGTENPGASVWPFALLAHVADHPVTMTHVIAWLNVLALWGFAIWVRATWPADDRRVGLSGVALFAVSPLPILFSRKIWAQDVLPIVLVPWLWGHARRERAAGAFAWGLFGALIGQVHMSGFFAAAALVIASLIVDRKRPRWRGWWLGSVLGALPLVPWLMFLAQRGPHGGERHWSLAFFWDAFQSGWGIGLRYSLGRDFGAFLRSPSIGGSNIPLVMAAHLALAALALWCAISLARNWRSLALSTHLQHYAWQLVLGGALLHLAGVKVYPHYLIVFSPLVHVAAAWVLARRKLWLWSACALQLFISASFLWFIHERGGAPRGDFGVSYRAQPAAERDEPVR